jgi:hypothetical protein
LGSDLGVALFPILYADDDQLVVRLKSKST